MRRKKQEINKYIEEIAIGLENPKAFFLGIQQINRHPHDMELALFLSTAIRTINSAIKIINKAAGYSE